MTPIAQCMHNIFEEIRKIETFSPAISNVLLEFFHLALNTLEAMNQNGHREKIDITEQLDLISRIFSIDLDLLLKEHVKQHGLLLDIGASSKEPDQTTLEFITGDLDDYERFLAQNKAKESLEFLGKNL